MNLKLIVFCIPFVFGQVLAQEKTNTPFGKGLYNVMAADSSWSMKFGLRIQSQFNGETSINDTSGFGASSSQFLIRRARLKFDGFAFSPRLEYKIELGLSNRDLGKADERTNFAPRMIYDAVIKWNFYQNFVLWAGQTKLPGNRERVISSANMQFVDRSLLNSVFNIDRDMGVQLRHHFKIGKSFTVREMVAVSQGEGRNLVQKNYGGLQYTSRLEILPFGEFKSDGDYFGSDLKREETPKLAVGLTYDYNDRAVKDRSNQGSYMSYDTDVDGEIDGYFQSSISTFFVDLMFKYKGLSIMGEYALRNADRVQQSTVNDDFSTTTRTVYVGNGLNVMVGYLFPSNWELAGRYTQISPEAVVGRPVVEQYGLAVSKFLVGHKLKVQGDVNYLSVHGSPESTLMYRLQFELHF